MKWKLGDLAGIGIFVHWSFWILPAWILLSTLVGGAGMTAAVTMVVFVFAVFGCVVLHELGHALMARHFGISTHDITLYPIGGIASLTQLPSRPSQELAISLAGPAVNVAIATVLFAGILLTGVAGQAAIGDPFGGSFLISLAWINVMLVAFNLLPAFPMDGGRVLRALLAMRIPYVRATTIAARVGQAVAVVLAFVGLFGFGGGMLLFVALFVFLAAQAELTMTRTHLAGWNAPPVSQPHWPPSKPSFHGTCHDEGAIIWVGDVRVDQDGRGNVRIISYRPHPLR
jgi:Zn-dependent protease